MIGRSVIAALALTCGMTCTVACASQPAGPHSESNGSAPKSVASLSPAPSSTGSLSPTSSSPASSTSIATYETETATPAAPTGAHPHPPARACVYPADEPPAAWDPGFVGMLQESDLVVEADIEDRFQRLSQVGDQAFWSQLIDNVAVLRSRTTPAPTVDGLDAQGDPGKPPYAWPTGRYVLLLLPPRSGLSSPSDGTFGMFRIVDGRALRFCPNYDDPANPLAASGNPPTVDELLALIPPDLPPPDVVSPKPSAATVIPAASSS
jgi:hypothetical protein